MVALDQGATMTHTLRSSHSRALVLGLLLASASACDGDGASPDGFEPLAVHGDEIVDGHAVGASDLAERLVAAFDRITVGVELISESDYEFRAFVVELDPAVPVDVDLLRDVLEWEGSPPDAPGDPFVLPASFEIQVRDDAGYWSFQAANDDDANRIRRYQEMERLMELNFVDQTIVGDQGSATSQIIGVTMTEDVVYAPYFMIGRLPTGELVGIKSFRVWT
jgi:hypothetical protein